jgi:large subunit ribosomal protein L4
MLNLQVFNTSGKPVGKVKMAEEIFAVDLNAKLLAQAVRVYLTNTRQASAKVKTRSQVRGSGRKIWRQKGTGRARHGDRYAPIFVGGGIAHGPIGKQNTKLNLSKKMRKKALFIALSQKIRDKELIIVDGLEKIEPKTKIANLKLQAIVNSNNKEFKKATIIISDEANNIVRAARNLPNFTLLSARNLNAYQIINSGTLIVMKDALRIMEQNFLQASRETKSRTKNVVQKSLTKKISKKISSESIKKNEKSKVKTKRKS